MTANGTLDHGTAAFATGKFGKALSGGVYTLPDQGTPAAATVECWVKVTTATGTGVFFGNNAAPAGWLGISVGNAAISVQGSGTTTASTTPIADGNWHHIACTWDGVHQTLWVDGAQALQVAFTGPLTLNSATGIGGYGTNTGFDWSAKGGLVDELRISKVVRYTAAFTPPTAAFADDTNTVSLYHLGSDANDSHGITIIPPNDANIVYSPYTWLVGSTSAKTICAGAYFRLLINGAATAIAAMFDVTNMATPASEIDYRIDHGPWTTATVAGSVALTMPTGNTWLKHTVEIVVKATTFGSNRWNSPQNTAVVFTGLKVTGVNLPTEAIQTQPLRVLVYGDSITEGLYTLNDSAANDVDKSDSRLSWAYLLGGLLGAEVGMVGFGGLGLTVAGSGNVPALPDSYALLWAGQARDFTPAPDVIVTNIGQNDGAADGTAAATGLINGLLTATPPATLIAVLRPFKGNQADQLQAAIAACDSPGRVTYIDTTGWFDPTDSAGSLHPYGYANTTSLGPQVADAVRDVLAGGAIYLAGATVDADKRISLLRL